MDKVREPFLRATTNKAVPLGLLLLLTLINPSVAAPIIVMADESPPYMGTNLPNKGFLPALFKEAMARNNIPTQTHIVPWARAIQTVKSGKSQVILGVFFTTERTKFLAFSNPITFVETVLFSLKGNQIHYQTLEDLKQYKIGVVRGSSYGEAFDNAEFVNKHEVVNETQNIDMLIYERLDLFAGSVDVLWHTIGNHAPLYLDKIETLKPPLSSRSLHIGFSKFSSGYTELLTTFNNSLAAMIKDGSLKKLGNEHGVLIN